MSSTTFGVLQAEFRLRGRAGEWSLTLRGVQPVRRAAALGREFDSRFGLTGLPAIIFNAGLYIIQTVHSLGFPEDLKFRKWLFRVGKATLLT